MYPVLDHGGVFTSSTGDEVGLHSIAISMILVHHDPYWIVSSECDGHQNLICTPLLGIKSSITGGHCPSGGLDILRPLIPFPWIGEDLTPSLLGVVGWGLD